jgi:very-short-patch-repair endonuclease
LRSKQPTGIERNTARALRELLPEQHFAQHINPFQRFTFPDFVDVKNKLAIYVDGTYWHGSDKAKAKDERQTRTLEAAGYSVLRIPEDIANDPIILKERIEHWLNTLEALKIERMKGSK